MTQAVGYDVVEPEANECSCGMRGRYTGRIKSVRGKCWGVLQCPKGHSWWALPATEESRDESLD